jgi:hypothetical protein
VHWSRRKSYVCKAHLRERVSPSETKSQSVTTQKVAQKDGGPWTFTVTKPPADVPSFSGAVQMIRKACPNLLGRYVEGNDAELVFHIWKIPEHEITLADMLKVLEEFHRLSEGKKLAVLVAAWKNDSDDLIGRSKPAVRAIGEKFPQIEKVRKQNETLVIMDYASPLTGWRPPDKTPVTGWWPPDMSLWNWMVMQQLCLTAQTGTIPDELPDVTPEVQRQIQDKRSEQIIWGAMHYT